MKLGGRQGENRVWSWMTICRRKTICIELKKWCFMSRKWASARNSQWHHSGAEQRRAGRRWSGPSGDETTRLLRGETEGEGRGGRAQKSTALPSVLKFVKNFTGQVFTQLSLSQQGSPWWRCCTWAWYQMSNTCLKISAFAATSGWSGVTDKTMIMLVLEKPHKYMFSPSVSFVRYLLHVHTVWWSNVSPLHRLYSMKTLKNDSKLIYWHTMCSAFKLHT